MANGTTTAVRPAGPKPKKSNTPAILGGLAVLFLGTTGYFYSQTASKTAVIAELQNGLASISKAAESDVYSLEKAAIATNQAQLLTGLTEAVANKVVDVQIARTEAQRQKDEAAKSSADRDALSMELSSTKQKLDTADKEIGTAKSNLSALQKKYDADLAKFEGDTKVLNEKIQELESRLAMASGVAADVATEPGSTEGESAAGAESYQTSIVVEEGASKLFKTARYESENRLLTFVTITDEKLVYANVPADVFRGLAAAPVMDLFYRFQIMEKYPSTPKDVDLIQAVTAADLAD